MSIKHLVEEAEKDLRFSQEKIIRARIEEYIARIEKAKDTHEYLETK